MAGNGENESTHHFQSFIRGYSSQNNHSTMLGTMADMKTIPCQNISCTALIEGLDIFNRFQNLTVFVKFNFQSLTSPEQDNLELNLTFLERKIPLNFLTLLKRKTYL